MTPKPTIRPVVVGSCAAPAKLYSKSATARGYLYGQYPPDWTALLTLKVQVCVAGSKIMWSTAKFAERRAKGVTGGHWRSTPFYEIKNSTTRRVLLTATFIADGLRSEPVVIIGFKVGSGFYEVTVGDELFH